MASNCDVCLMDVDTCAALRAVYPGNCERIGQLRWGCIGLRDQLDRLRSESTLAATLAAERILEVTAERDAAAREAGDWQLAANEWASKLDAAEARADRWKRLARRLFAQRYNSRAAVRALSDVANRRLSELVAARDREECLEAELHAATERGQEIVADAETMQAMAETAWRDAEARAERAEEEVLRQNDELKRAANELKRAANELIAAASSLLHLNEYTSARCAQDAADRARAQHVALTSPQSRGTAEEEPPVWTEEEVAEVHRQASEYDEFFEPSPEQVCGGCDGDGWNWGTGDDHDQRYTCFDCAGTGRRQPTKETR